MGTPSTSPVSVAYVMVMMNSGFDIMRGFTRETAFLLAIAGILADTTADSLTVVVMSNNSGSDFLPAMTSRVCLS